MKLFRAISLNEKIDFEKNKFQSSRNTLEGKQFFKSKNAVIYFIKLSKKRDFNPPYLYVLEIEIDEECLSRIDYDEIVLDFNQAISIHEDYLPEFNKCLKFVEPNEITNYI